MNVGFRVWHPFHEIRDIVAVNRGTVGGLVEVRPVLLNGEDACCPGLASINLVPNNLHKLPGTWVGKGKEQLVRRSGNGVVKEPQGR